MPTNVTLPELGEGIEQAEVIRVLVAAGDSVKADQPLIEIETDKATVEVPAPQAGVVSSVAVAEGGTLKVGELILTLGDDDGAAAGDGASTDVSTDVTPAEASDETASSGETTPAEGSEETAPAASSGEAASAEAPAGAADTEPAAPTAAAARGETRDSDRTTPTPPTPAPPVGTGPRVLAAPSVRKLAREIGVEIEAVGPSGRGDRVTLDDVKTHAKRALEEARAGRPAEAPLPDFSAWGPVERTPLRGIRRTMARRMSQAWRAVPHVTQHDEADITEFEAVRTRLKKTAPDRPLTVTALAVAVVAAALREFPQFNASLDMTREEVVQKDYVHVGVAVDTDRGLLVPVIRDADRKRLGDLAVEIAALAEKVRDGKATPDELQGGTFTITNLGGLGGTSFTPIVNYPEVAILGLSRSKPSPVWTGERFEPRPLLPLSLSYDHRLIDGADAVRFLRWIADRIAHPMLLEI